MDCNSQIHDELKNMGQSKCPFCDRLLVEFHKVVESCCSEQDMETEWYEYLCELWFSSRL